MSLEAYTGKISDLVDSNPTPTDPKSQGDDHLRGIKYTLKQTFPNFDGPTTQFPGQVTPNEITIGRNADQSKNFNITVPSPEDGTLTIERGDGTDVMKFLANGGVDMPTLPFSKAVNGYMTLPNGMIVQWGIESVTAGTVSTVTLPTPFSAPSTYSPQATIDQAAATASQFCAVTRTSASQLSITVNTGTGLAHWIAIGY